MSRLLWVAVLSAWLAPAPSAAEAQPAAGAQGAKPLATLDELFGDVLLVDVAVSPSGRYIAVVTRDNGADSVVVIDDVTGKRHMPMQLGATAAGAKLDAKISNIYWKSDDRLLFRTQVRFEEGQRAYTSDRILRHWGDRLFAIDRDGGNIVRLLADNRNSALAGALDLGSIRSFLPKDPHHVLMDVEGFDGLSLFRVDLRTGAGEMVERPLQRVFGWWLDVEGRPVVRFEVSGGTISFSRKEENGNWKRYYKIRVRDLERGPEYDPVGPSNDPGRYYVLARPPGRERIGLYLYDLKNESFGEPIVENSRYDLDSAQTSRDGARVLQHCYYTHVRTCEFSNEKLDAHMRAIRRHFSDAANIYIHDISDDGNVLALYVDSPSEPPTYHVYRMDKRNLAVLGYETGALTGRAFANATVFTWTARDGLELSGYLTLPPTPRGTSKLPLLVYPHGGPEVRDHLTFDVSNQYFASRGYAIFQPNFRGSSGFGASFAERGYKQWGARMQDDITDGLSALIERGIVDPQRVCIVGASYGGYAALAGATLTPDLYRCAVSINGVTDLADFVAYRRKKWGEDSDAYTYSLKSIGDPKADAARLAATSPARLADRVRVPILLIHGDDDAVVPISQSRLMKKALDKASKPAELMVFKGEGHSYWSTANEKRHLIAIDRFLWKHLGPGHGNTTPPLELPPESRN